MWGATDLPRWGHGAIAISIHAPRVGSDDGERGECMPSPEKFQSTLPVWGATRVAMTYREYLDISIHAPRVGSDRGWNHHLCYLRISIHAPRVGSDHLDLQVFLIKAYFNPRSPCGERPYQNLPTAIARTDFNPRSPCGERQSESLARKFRDGFQSTLPVWGATIGIIGAEVS